ncbi:MAG: diguanylate cyclase [Pseudomonas sp.]|uniref:diguanylate cyclase domain-containing protein n=1 Tax=Pseudomonas sp. TaxID=306 RepID=UPI002736BA3F|nr:diguanylate cyclase [Pseudomonas sp.]MDP3848323.1 diguanylate cyclase [Pseudomonas sp.]
MNYSIRFKLSCAFTLFGILLTVLIGYYAYATSRSMLLSAAERDLLTATQVLGRNLQSSLANATQDLRLLYSLPQTRNLVERAGKNRAAEEASELAETFSNLLKLHPQYLQIRLIGTAEHGLERVRVERDGQQLVRSSAAQLQEKAHLPYVFQARTLPPGSVYLSPITINHELGAHSGLNQPTITLSSPLASSANPNSTSDLMVLNIGLNQLFQQLQSDLPPHYQVFLSNELGDILIHPDASQTFGFDGGRRILLQDSFPAVADLLLGSQLAIKSRSTQDQSLVASFVRLQLDEHDTQRFVILGLAQPAAFIVSDAHQLGWGIAKVVAILSLLTVLLAALTARAITRPLHQMMVSIKGFARDRSVLELPVLRSDELGQLARSFHDMQLKILEQLNELQASRNALVHLAQHDPLTGLPNRRCFFERLEHAIANARRSGKPLAVLFVDLDHFKQINDHLGHGIGDQVLQTIARQLSSITREVDTVARLGGDEFVILLEHFEQTKDILQIVQKLHERFQSSLLIDGHELNIRASIGVSLYPRDGISAEQLLQFADSAMYSAKNSGRNTYTFHYGGEY